MGNYTLYREMFWKYGKIGSGFVIARERRDRGDLPLICRLFGYRVEVRYVGLNPEGRCTIPLQALYTDRHKPNPVTDGVKPPHPYFLDSTRRKF